NRAAESFRDPVVVRRHRRRRRGMGYETGTSAHAPDSCCHPHSWSLRYHVFRYDVDAQDSGSDDSFTQTAVTQISTLFHLFEGLGNQCLLALAREQTVPLFAFEIAQQINEVVLRLRQPCPTRQVSVVRRGAQRLKALLYGLALGHRG